MQTLSPIDGHDPRLVYERVLPAVPTAVGQLRRELDAELSRIAVPPMRRHDVALVLTEAAANVVVHAYPDAPRPGLVYALASVLGATLELDVFDSGSGMVPGSQSAGLGVGLALIARLADALDIAPNPDGGLKVTAVFRDISSERDHPASPVHDRASRIQEYVAALHGTSQALHGETRALMAEAETAVDRAVLLRQTRFRARP